jgi:hypothetical protein
LWSPERSEISAATTSKKLMPVAREVQEANAEYKTAELLSN